MSCGLFKKEKSLNNAIQIYYALIILVRAINFINKIILHEVLFFNTIFHKEMNLTFYNLLLSHNVIVSEIC